MAAGALVKAMRKMKPKGEMTKQIPKGASHLRGSGGRAGGGLDTTRNKHPTKQQQPIPGRPNTTKHHLQVADRNTTALDSPQV